MSLLRQATKAGERNDWSEFLKSEGLNAWSRVQVQECFHEAGGRSPEERGATDFAAEHGLPEADHRVSRRAGRGHAPANGACANLVCALKHLANQELGENSLVQVLVEGLQEQSRINIIGAVNNRRLGEELGGAPCGRA